MADADPAPDAFEAPAAALKSLAHPKRLRLLRFLAEPHSLEEIASELHVARQSAQEHLDQLLAAGFVEPRRGRGDHGPVTHYVVVVARLFDVYEQLGQRVGIIERELDEHVHVPLRTSPLGAAGVRGQLHGPRLTIVHGMRVGHTTVLDGAGPWLLGRDPAASVCLDYDPFVSGRHAEVRRATGGFELADLYSSNGTYRDWERLGRGAAAPLANGALVRVGKTLLHFRTA